MKKVMSLTPSCSQINSTGAVAINVNLNASVNEVVLNSDDPCDFDNVSISENDGVVHISTNSRHRQMLSRKGNMHQIASGENIIQSGGDIHQVTIGNSIIQNRSCTPGRVVQVARGRNII